MNEHVAWFSAESIAWQVTLVVPVPNWLPDSALQVTVSSSPELSVAFGLSQLTSSTACPKLTSIDWSMGQLIIVGAWVSVNQCLFPDSYCKQCVKINIFHVLIINNHLNWWNFSALVSSLECYLQDAYLTCHQCFVIYEKNAQTVTKLVWGTVPP